MADAEQDEYDDYYPDAPPPKVPEIILIRDTDSRAPLCVFDDPTQADIWMDDFDEETDRFEVVRFPGKFPLLLLEYEGMRPAHMPLTHEGQLWNALRELRGEGTDRCRLYRFTENVNESEMLNIESHWITKEWIEEVFNKDLPWEEDPSEEDAKWMFNHPEVDDEELKKIAMGMHSGTIFSTDHMGPHDMNLVGSVFMPMILGGVGYARHSVINNITLVYEYLSEAGPRSINGMPIFFSCRLLNRKQHKRMYEKLNAIKAVLEAV